MVNLTVINLKDILKFLIKIICLIIIICVIFNLVRSIKQVNCINKLTAIGWSTQYDKSKL